MGTIKKDDIISFQMTLKFFYKNCEVTFRKFNGVNVIQVIGLSNFGNILESTKTFNKKLKDDLIMECLKREKVFIEEVYQDVANKEFGVNNTIGKK